MSEDERRVEALIQELRAITDVPPAEPSDETDGLVAELRRETNTVGAALDTRALEAARAPLLHRSQGRTQEFLDSITALAAGVEPCLEPRRGSANRDAMLQAHDEALSVYFWVGFCAYEQPDPDLVILWAPEAEQTGPPGFGAPWDTAGLATKATLGRNISTHEAATRVAKYSLPTTGTPAPYRVYLAEVLRCSFDGAIDMFEGRAPVRWYPGWEMAPPREQRGGTPAEPPHHTFEVRRSGAVGLAPGILGIVARDGVFRPHTGARRRLEGLLRNHAVWARGRRLILVPSRDTVSRNVRSLVRQWMTEGGT